MIKKYFSALAALATFILLNACVTTGGYNAYNQVVQQWQGEKTTHLVSVWGYPDSEMKLPSGNTVYVYKHEQQYTTPGAPVSGPVFVTPGGPVIPSYGMGFGFNNQAGQTITMYCRTWFEANRKGIIVNTQSEGNNCALENRNNLAP